MYRCLLLLCGLAAVGAVKYVTVSSSTCGDEINMDSTGDVYLSYTGAALGYSKECTIKFKTSDSSNSVCVEAKSLSIGCQTTMEYHGGVLTQSLPDRSFSCHDKQYSDWCYSLSEIWVRFKGGKGSDNIELRIYSKDTWGSNLVSHVVTSVYVIIGVVVGVVVLVIIIIVITIICCCKRRSRQGTVYRSPQQAMPVTAVPVGGYQPPPQQMGYQYPPQQTGYQPPPQGYTAGYQPPPQGYQPPPQGYQPTGYPPESQQGYAGYQNAPNTKTVEASAPPMGSDFPMQNVEQPPPYPGN